MRHLSGVALTATLLVAGAGFLARGAYIPAKAWLAQLLLETAWERRLDGDADARPWPWADTRPIARLKQERLGIAQIVLAGTSGRVLAFGPGHVTGTARPGESGNVVISGHRDTHFRWLAGLQAADRLSLETDDGRSLRYEVARTSVHHENDVGLLNPLDGDQLRLLTCYPFDAVAPGTPDRFVVTALPLRP
ncbi:MAG: class GN sortase [Sedimenticolaceae bacterium]